MIEVVGALLIVAGVVVLALSFLVRAALLAPDLTDRTYGQ